MDSPSSNRSSSSLVSLPLDSMRIHSTPPFSKYSSLALPRKIFDHSDQSSPGFLPQIKIRTPKPDYYHRESPLKIRVRVTSCYLGEEYYYRIKLNQTLLEPEFTTQGNVYLKSVPRGDYLLRVYLYHQQDSIDSDQVRFKYRPLREASSSIQEN